LSNAFDPSPVGSGRGCSLFWNMFIRLCKCVPGVRRGLQRGSAFIVVQIRNSSPPSGPNKALYECPCSYALFLLVRIALIN